ncbi:Uncharacterised protein [Yersinia intermedia]|nr:Uncharacterised protein [Yersinia intermedia]
MGEPVVYGEKRHKKLLNCDLQRKLGTFPFHKNQYIANL